VQTHCGPHPRAEFKDGTLEAYKTNISAIRNAAAMARGEAI
jgi:ribulose-phosphate 3-epimerase